MGGTAPRLPAPVSDAPSASRLYYGWTMLLAVAMAQLVSWGVLYYGFSVFVPPVRRELGWDVPQITGAFSLSLACSGLAAPFVGRWVDAHGPRLLMTLGSVAAALLVVAWSRVTDLVAFYLVWTGIGVAASCVLYEPAFAIVSAWFVRRRSLALTVLTFIGGFASVVFVPLAAWLQGQYGWRTALTILAATLALVTVPIHALLLRRRPQDMGLLPDGAAIPPPGAAPASHAEIVSVPRAVAIRSASFRWLNIGFGLVLFANLAVAVLLIPYLVDRGYDATFAASAAGAIGLLSLPGRLIFTPLGGRVPRRYLTALIFALQTAGIVALALAQSAAGVWAFVVLFGAGFGALTPARAGLVMELYGPAHYGSIAGVVALIRTVSQGAAPLAGGLLYAALGGYVPVFWVMAGISAVSIAAILRLEKPVVVGG